MSTAVPTHAGMTGPDGADVAVVDGPGLVLGSVEGDGSGEGVGEGLGSGSGVPTVITPHIPSRGPPWY